ncbi:MAG: flippase [Gammaproteobacteria bacterium]|nr:MAG: flippase [Gammaproteobacteria bacterium]
MNRWIVNIGSSYARFLVAIAAVVFVTPIIIERVGLEAYGIWALVLATVGLLGLMDFGLATSAVKFIAERTGDADRDGRNRVMCALFTVYTGISIALLLGVTVATLGGPGESMFGETRGQAVLLLAVGGSVAAGLFLSLFRAALAGAGLMYLANVVEIMVTFLYVSLTLLFLGLDYGVPGLAAALLMSSSAGAISLAIIARLRIEGLRPRLTLMRWREVKGLLSFSIWAFVANAAVLAILRMDPIIIKAFMPLSAVAVYAIAGRIAEYVLLLNKQFSNALMPLVSQAHGRGDEAVVERVLLDGSRYLMAIALPMLALLAFHAETLLLIWLGEDLRAATTPLRLLSVAVGFSIIQLNAANVLGMTGRHRFVAITMGASAALNLVVTIALIPAYGLVGAATATLITAGVVEMGVILPVACRHLGIKMRTFLHHALVPGMVGAVSATAVAAALATQSPPDSLTGLVIHGSTAVAVAMPAMLFVGLSRSERESLSGTIARFGRRRSVANEGIA